MQTAISEFFRGKVKDELVKYQPMEAITKRETIADNISNAMKKELEEKYFNTLVDLVILQIVPIE